MIDWISAVLAGFGGGICGAFVIEVYQQRRAQNELGENDVGLE